MPGRVEESHDASREEKDEDEVDFLHTQQPARHSNADDAGKREQLAAETTGKRNHAQNSFSSLIALMKKESRALLACLRPSVLSERSSLCSCGRLFRPDLSFPSPRHPDSHSPNSSAIPGPSISALVSASFCAASERFPCARMIGALTLRYRASLWPVNDGRTKLGTKSC